MALRTFTDLADVEWQVWDVRPLYRGMANTDLEGGWLVFQSPTEKRRLRPIPPDWESCPPERLYLLSRVAPSADSIAA
ncbi:MAG: hypothetical protein H0X52_08465 [Gemmatimonadetes bacterium]|jgi:hypothetical protein|nr:hypothetical protein [Gemmatimonadota bacterium]MDQ3521337.1 hypothetical protein [Gemmatimonadota bacterium]